jgi:hypothetical protein
VDKGFLPPWAQYLVTAFAVASAPVGLYAAWMSVRVSRLTMRLNQLTIDEKERAAKKAKEEDSPIYRPSWREVLDILTGDGPVRHLRTTSAEKIAFMDILERCRRLRLLLAVSCLLNVTLAIAIAVWQLVQFGASACPGRTSGRAAPSTSIRRQRPAPSITVQPSRGRSVQRPTKKRPRGEDLPGLSSPPLDSACDVGLHVTHVGPCLSALVDIRSASRDCSGVERHQNADAPTHRKHMRWAIELDPKSWTG